MTITMTPAAAALRPRTLSTQASPSTLSLAGVASWRGCTPLADIPAFMPNTSALRTNRLDHNSIVSTVAVVAPAQDGRSGYGAAKQAAPPRGVPR